MVMVQHLDKMVVDPHSMLMSYQRYKLDIQESEELLFISTELKQAVHQALLLLNFMHTI